MKYNSIEILKFLGIVSLIVLICFSFWYILSMFVVTIKLFDIFFDFLSIFKL